MPIISGISVYIIALSSFVVAVLNGGVLAFGMHSKRMLHSDLKKKWIELLKDVEVAGLNTVNELVIVDLEKKMASIHSVEPPANLKKLEKAQDYTERALGLLEDIQKANFLGRMTMKSI